MKTWVAVGAVILAAGNAFAQGQQEDPVESRVQRYKEQLNLTDEQLPKIREIVKKQIEEMRAILTDEQKTRLDGGARGGRGNNQGNNNQGGGFGNLRGGWLPPTNDLKTSVALTDDQVTKINEIRDAVRQEMRTFFQNRGRGGNPQDLAAQFNAFQEKSKKETTEKITALLTDEQKPKFEEALKKYAASQPQPGQPRGGDNTTQDFAARRAGSLDERVGRVMENLKIADAKEADAIKGLVKKVLEATDKLDAYNRETRTKMEEASRNQDLSDDAVGEKITEIMKGQHDLEKEVNAARKALTEVVTNRQELELLRRGLLR
jgi:hypothetical protein